MHGKKLESKYIEPIVQSPSTNQALFLRILLDHIKNIATFDNLSEVINNLLKSNSIFHLFGLILSDWEHIFPVDLIKSSLSALYYASTGLSELELKILSSASSSDWNSYFSTLSRFLNVTSDRIYSIFHPCFRKVILSFYPLSPFPPFLPFLPHLFPSLTVLSISPSFPFPSRYSPLSSSLFLLFALPFPLPFHSPFHSPPLPFPSPYPFLRSVSLPCLSNTIKGVYLFCMLFSSNEWTGSRN